MITNSTRVEENKFYVDFNVKPKDLKHKRQYPSEKAYTATHIGGGTTKRLGIKEGIEIKSIKTKVGDKAWRDRDIDDVITSYSSYNGTEIQISVTYTLKTMGWQWKDYTGTYPFFWYGNIGNVPYKYREGSFRDSTPKNPGKEHTICAVPPDWKLVKVTWSDWAYKHAKETPNYDKSNGKYEERNMAHDTSSETTKTGWLSESKHSQITRKSMMFIFEKTYTMSVTSSGIQTFPDAPTLNVKYAKGDSGQITVTHNDPSNKSATLRVEGTCNDKTVDVVTHSNSGVLENGQSKTFTIDFNECFGEQYRGNDIKYEAWSKNTLDNESKNSSGKKGVHRYNGRPSIPSISKVEGMSEGDVIYDFVNIYWNSAIDPDEDSLVYDVWMKATDLYGKTIKDSSIATNVNNTKLLNYDIQSFADKTNFEVKVRAYDGQIYSDWSSPYFFQKGAIPQGSLALIAPSVSGTTLYNTRPRFVFEGYDQSSTFVFVYKNSEYNSQDHPNMFTKSGSRVMFKPNFDMAINESFSCYGYMKNKYGKSEQSNTFYFTIKNPVENINEGEIMKAQSVKEVYALIQEFARAYGRIFNQEIGINYLLTKDTFNSCNSFLKSVNSYLNSLVSTSDFDYSYPLADVQTGQINDDQLWDNLVNQLKNI